MTHESPFACVMEAIAPQQRDPHIANAKSLFKQVIEVKELENGYSFRFQNEERLLTQLMEFIVLERLCCPFFGFALEVEPEAGAVRFRLTGRAGVKPFIRAELNDFLTIRSEFRKTQGNCGLGAALAESLRLPC
jgi:hypothetical protein